MCFKRVSRESLVYCSHENASHSVIIIKIMVTQNIIPWWEVAIPLGCLNVDGWQMRVAKMDRIQLDKWLCCWEIRI